MQTDLFRENFETKNSSTHYHSENVELNFVSKNEINHLDYSFQTTQFGEVIIASSKKGIYWLAFISSWRQGLTDLSESFPNVEFTEQADDKYEAIIQLFAGKKIKKKIKLYVSGSDFQLKVWQELLKIPFGETTSYGEIATVLDLPIGASRAIGTAVGKNPIAFLIPCHRVIQLSGKLGGYRWGLERKKDMLFWES